MGMAESKKRRLIKDAGGRCTYCGVLLVDGNTTYDHIIPKSKGGMTTGNMVACCRGCNGIKWDHSVEVFRDIMRRTYQLDKYVFYFERKRNG